LFTREDVVKLPHFMALLGYMMRTYRLPRLIHKDNGIVYHYTDANGLVGIINSGKLWSTNTSFLNDPSEGSYALDVANNVLAVSRTMLAAEQATILESLGKLEVPDHRSYDVFVTSFCREGDLLSQWRGYGAFGDGFALGFSIAELVPHPQYGQLIEVSYGPTELRKCLEDGVNIFLEYARANPAFYLALADDFAATISFIAAGCKHPAYEQEHEIRLLLRRSRRAEDRERETDWYKTPISYRARGSDVVPYISTLLTFPDIPGFKDTLPFRVIIFGPGVSFEKNKRSIEALLASKGYTGLKLRPSAVPFTR
jgi:Protein of unknown function (DUF2971)